MSSSEQSKKTVAQQSHEPNPSHLEPFNYINNVPGKDVRGKLIDCFQLWLNIPSEQKDVLLKIKEIVGDLHNASLLIDDIEDNSHLRRGVPVAHKIYGVAPVINCANYMYFIALDKCHALNNQKAMQVFVQEMLNLHRGQGNDIMWRDNLSCPTEEQYCQMVIDKTGGLFRLAVGLMQSFASTKINSDFTPLVDKLAMYFQIRDDLINLADPEYFKSKSFCEDLTEGKFSFPIIHCVRNDPLDHTILSILKQKTSDLDVKKYAQGFMREAGSLVYTRERCRSLKVEIIQLVDELGGNTPLLKLLDILDVQVDGLTDDVVSPQGKLNATNGNKQIDSA